MEIFAGGGFRADDGSFLNGDGLKVGGGSFLNGDGLKVSGGSALTGDGLILPDESSPVGNDSGQDETERRKCVMSETRTGEARSARTEGPVKRML